MQATTIKRDELHTEVQHAAEEASTTPTSTALAPVELIIEGEVTEIIEPQEHTPTPKQRPYYLIPVCTIIACVLFLTISRLLPLLTPTATVIILPNELGVSTTANIQIQGRALPSLMLSQSITTPATGKRHQNTEQAVGMITLYNGLLSSQAVSAGTIVTGIDGVQVQTDQTAIIPPGNPPTYGQITVSAHAVNPGSQGNISADDIHTACCFLSVVARNTRAFSGGQNEREYTVITRSDLQNAASTLTTSLLKSERAAFHAQLTPGEVLIPPLCQQTTAADHQAGDETTEAHVTVSETCSAVAYTAHSLNLHAMQMITKEARQRLGTGYALFGELGVHVVSTAITDEMRGTATLGVQIAGTYVYRISQAQRQQLIRRIAGKSKLSAIHTLVSVPGIQQAIITISGQSTTLPSDPAHIHLVMLYQEL